MDYSQKTFPIWVWLVFALLFALSVPWYLPGKLAMHLVLGLPLWVVSSIAAVCVCACFTYWAIHTYWKEA